MRRKLLSPLSDCLDDVWPVASFAPSVWPSYAHYADPSIVRHHFYLLRPPQNLAMLNSALVY